MQNSQKVSFFWIGSGANLASANNAITLSCTDQNSNNLTASATYSVSQPTIAITPTYNTTTTAFAANGYWWNGFLLSTFNAEWQQGDETLIFGNPDPNNVLQAGVHWPWTITPPVGGTIGMAQIKTVSISGTLDTGQQWVDKDNTVGCNDGGVPYAGKSVMINAGAAVVSGAFSDYFMYRPTADKAGPSIWISLATLDWSHTNVSATQQAAGWTFDAAPVESHPANVTISNALPTWGC
jgi:hypothetical protein